MFTVHAITSDAFIKTRRTNMRWKAKEWSYNFHVIHKTQFERLDGKTIRIYGSLKLTVGFWATKYFVVMGQLVL
jgi:hypothetical protein